MTDEMQQYVASAAAKQQQMHGHSHGHGHQGGCEHGHGHGNLGHQPTAIPTQMQEMIKMAVGTLSPIQRETMERVKRNMMQGQPPKPEDAKAMAIIQQHIAAFMQTMGQFASNNSSSSNSSSSSSIGNSNSRTTDSDASSPTGVGTL
uniref:Uncharacterized protein n=1 Tax=Lygus hesperus TaxID=30085 RepID=A0A146KJA1_LYGHE